MTHTDQTTWNLDQGPAIVRALSSLRHQDAAAVADAVAKLGAGWSVTASDDYDGYLTILIEPTEQPETRPSYLISGTTNHVELAELRGDDMTTLSISKALSAAVERILQALKTHG